MSERKVQPVSFSLTDPFEKDLWEFAMSKGFSKYIKRLIQRDKECGIIQPIRIEIEEPLRKKAVASSFL